eukprot:8178445-Pyramimonas_sp.AAC.1
MRCPVWAPLPQTPQAGEFSGYWGAVMCLTGPSTIITDCANVVTQHELPRDAQTFFKRLYAGVFVQLLSRPERRHIREVLKIKAHQSLSEEGISAQEEASRLGNHLADLGAKEALAFHPSDSDVLEEANESVKFARAACKLAAKLLPEFAALSSFKDVSFSP